MKRCESETRDNRCEWEEGSWRLWVGAGRVDKYRRDDCEKEFVEARERERQIVMMKPEEDFDAVLIVDWMGNSPQSLSGKLKNGPQNAATESPIAVKNESWTKAPAPARNTAPPVYYELSDSDGTPIRPRCPVRSLAERRAAAAIKPPSISSKLNANADVVTLDSDSDEEISPSAKFGGKVDKLSQPRTQGDLPHKPISLDDEGNLGSKLTGTIVKLTETVPQGGLLHKTISLDDEGTVGVSKFSGNPFTETIPQEGLLEKATSVEIEGCLVGSTSSRTDLPPQGETAAAVQMCDLPLRSDGDVQFSRDAQSTAGNTLRVVQELNGAMQNSLIAGDTLLLQTACGFFKRPTFSVEDSDHPDAAQGVMRITQHSLREESHRSSPPKPACGVLTLSDDDISPTTEIPILGKLGQLREPISQGGILGKSRPSPGNEEISTVIAFNRIDQAVKAIRADLVDHRSQKTHVPSTLLGSLAANPYSTTKTDVGDCYNYVQTTRGSGKLTSCAAEGPKLLSSAQEAGLGAGPVFVPEEENRRSSPVRPMVEILTSDDDGCNSEPEWLRDHGPASPMTSRRSGGFVSHDYRDEKCSEQFLPDSRGNSEVRDHDACQNRPSRDIPGHESHENQKTTVSTSATDGPKMMAPVPVAVSSCLGVKDSVPEENRRSFPDHPVFDLTGDSDGCSSEPEWMREPNSQSGSWGQGSGADSHGLGNKRSLLQIPDLQSPEKFEYTVFPRGDDSESGEEILGGAKAKRKRRRVSGAAAERRALDDASNWESTVSNSQRISKARKGQLSEEELAAKEAQKQRERELKKARQEEGKRRKQEEKEELKRQKAEAAEKRKLEKEQEKEGNKWRKGKFALQNTTVCVDNKVMEMKELGPLLLRQLGDNKPYKFVIVSNPIPNSIVWKMKRPAADSQMDSEGLGSQADYLINSQLSNSQLALEEVEMDYVVVVIQGEDFADRVGENRLLEYHSGVRQQYPKHYICYIINGLMKHVQKKEQQQYKSGDQNWIRPNVEQALAEFITHHPKVHSRSCMDECEIADHIIGLTRGLAECPFKQKLTSISVKANGDHVSKGDPNKDIIKKNIWLKFLVALPKINGAIAIAVANQYPTMRSLLDAYHDRRRPEHEKELLLQDLIKETSGGVSRKIGPHFSKCIYRILMAKDGNLSTEDVQDGADHFT